MSWLQHFDALADHLSTGLPSGEGFTLSLEAEDTSFVRFNRGRVRQPGDVRQARVSLRMVRGQRHTSSTVTLTGDPAADRKRLTQERDALRQMLGAIPEDPHLLLNTQPVSTRSVASNTLPDARTATGAIADAVRDLDMVGIFATGGMHRAFANHLGQRNHFTSHAFLLDFSLVASGDKAVKLSYGGTAWSDVALLAKVTEGRSRLDALSRPAHTLKPGAYRAFLAPAAVGEVFDLLSWDAFSLRAQRAGSSPLSKLIQGRASFDRQVTLLEHTAEGLGPNFQGAGFLKPDAVPLITDGKHTASLVSPRSAREYGVAHNGASDAEQPCAIALAAGSLPKASALSALGTGVWVSNLWYLNHSDRNAGRITGMTRFATFWVEGGQLVAPLAVMRFDDPLYDLLGSNLQAITAERELMPSASTYDARSTDVQQLPGVLTRLTFTL